jgi:regulator of PEP synthase PpsR (kinase-PPPase family)
MRAPHRRYAELLDIYDELELAASVHRRLGCPVIDVSDLSVEATAMQVIRLVDQRRREAGRR